MANIQYPNKGKNSNITGEISITAMAIAEYNPLFSILCALNKRATMAL